MRALALLALAAAAGLAGAAAARDLDEAIGRALFVRAWVPAPSSARANDGLGPLHNARSCAACHAGLERQPVRLDSAGAVAGDNLVLRFSDAAGRPDPAYGGQLQTLGLPAVAPEGRIARGQASYAPADLAYGPLAPSTRTGARLAPALLGLGALERVPDAAIEGIAAEQVQGGDGVSGRPNWVVGADGKRRVGRFGSKAASARLVDQVETAFALDLGLSTPGRPAPEGDCTPRQAACRAAPHGDEGAEIPAELVALVARFLASRAAPEPPEPDPRGASLFSATGCAACHRPALPSPDGPVRAYTDLLLHDLGPALDGGATEPGAAPAEWRTAPLWGLSRTLANGARLLHDGRARTVAEAIDLHGGEAARARARVHALPEEDRARLLAFVSAL